MRIAWTGLLAVMLFVSCKEKDSSPAEPDNIGIRKMLNSYHRASQKQDWASVTELIHPDVFKYVSKKDFEKALQNAMDGDGFNARIKATDIDSIYPSFVHKGNKYALVRLKVTIEMLLTAGSDSSTRQFQDDVCDQLRAGDEENFIDCRTVENGLEYSAKDFSYAVYLARKKKWFFLSKDEDTEEIANKIIPAEVREKFGY